MLELTGLTATNDSSLKQTAAPDSSGAVEGNDSFEQWLGQLMQQEQNQLPEPTSKQTKATDSSTENTQASKATSPEEAVEIVPIEEALTTEESKPLTELETLQAALQETSGNLTETAVVPVVDHEPPVITSKPAEEIELEGELDVDTILTKEAAFNAIDKTRITPDKNLPAVEVPSSVPEDSPEALAVRADLLSEELTEEEIIADDIRLDEHTVGEETQPITAISGEPGGHLGEGGGTQQQAHTSDNPARDLGLTAITSPSTGPSFTSLSQSLQQLDPSKYLTQQLTDATLQGIEDIAAGTTSAIEGSMVTLQLRPDELGSVRVRINRSVDGIVNARFVVERGDALELMKSSAGKLAQALNDHGLEVGEIDFKLAGSSADSNAEQRFSQANQLMQEQAFRTPQRHASRTQAKEGFDSSELLIGINTGEPFVDEETENPNGRFSIVI